MKDFKLDYTMAIDAGLGFGYDPKTGNIILEKNEQSPENINKAIRLLQKYPNNLIMGIEGEEGKEYLFIEEYLFISEKEFFI